MTIILDDTHMTIINLERVDYIDTCPSIESEFTIGFASGKEKTVKYDDYTKCVKDLRIIRRKMDLEPKY